MIRFVVFPYVAGGGRLWSWRMESNGRPVARSYDPFSRRASALRSARAMAEKMNCGVDTRVEVAKR